MSTLGLIYLMQKLAYKIQGTSYRILQGESLMSFCNLNPAHSVNNILIFHSNAVKKEKKKQSNTPYVC